VRIRTITILLVTALVGVGASPAFAQMNGMTLGVKAGFNISSLSVDEDELDVDKKSRAGLVAGVFMVKELRRNFALQIEALVSQKGVKFENFALSGEDLKVRLTYLEIPVLARYTLPMNMGGTNESRIHVLAGPTIGFKVSDSQKLGDEDLEEEFDQDLKGADVGLAIGAAFEMRKFLIDVRYTFGLMNINDDLDEDELSVKNRTFTISVGWRIR